MSILIKKAGLQTTLQSAPYKGYRHIGMPSAGAADPLSLALANRLVHQAANAAALEITLSGAAMVFQSEAHVAVTGAVSYVKVNKESRNTHETISLKGGDSLEIGPAKAGCRAYLACSRPFQGSMVMGTLSTYMPASLAGFKGRALADGDIIPLGKERAPEITSLSTPLHLRPFFGLSHVLRIVAGPEFDLLGRPAQISLSARPFIVSQRSSRMGIELNNVNLSLASPVHMNSSATFIGTIQLPPSGRPFLLGCDAQTTGGYPRIAQVIRADRHLIGQLRPGDNIRFIMIDRMQAQAILRAKMEILGDWVSDIVL